MELRSFYDEKHKQYLALGNHNQAEQVQAWLENDLKNDPQDVQSWLLKGHLFHRQGFLDKALFCFDQAACLDPYNVEAILTGSIILADLGFYKEAKTRFESSSQILPPPPQPHSWDERLSPLPLPVMEHIGEHFVELAHTLENLGLKKQAFKLIDQAAKEYPCWQLFFMRALYYFKNQQIVQATEQIEMARLHHDSVMRHMPIMSLWASLLHLVKGDWQLAQNEYNQATQGLGTASPTLHKLLGALIEENTPNHHVTEK